MTLLAGFLALQPDKGRDDRLRCDLATSLQRNRSLSFLHAECGPLFVAKVDIGAHIGSGLLEDGQRLAAMYGHPHLDTPETTYRNRDLDLQELVHAIETDRIDVIATRINGHFGLVHYNKQDRSLMLFNDVIGIQPIYYSLEDDLLIFANQLRIMASLRDLSLSINHQVAQQIASFGHPLKDRSVAEEIKILEPGFALCLVEGQRPCHRLLQNIEAEAAQLMPVQNPAETVRRCLDRAVRRRAIPQRDVEYAFLSGGLDSRIVTGILSTHHHDIVALNVSAEKTLDRVLAHEVALAGGIKLVQLEDMAPSEHPIMMVPLISERYIGKTVNRVWSGDGGSVLLGGVYLDGEIAAKMRGATTEEVVDTIMATRSWRPSGLILGRDFIDSAITVNRMELGSFVAARVCRRKAFYTFLLYGDQRFHLAPFWENIDAIGVDIVLPLFDIELIRVLMSMDDEEIISHRLYHKLLERFPDWISKVPWQAYPGHEPCPLPLPEGAVGQWDYERLRDKSEDRRQLREFARSLPDAEALPPLVLPPWLMRHALPYVMRFTNRLDHRVNWLRRYCDALQMLRPDP